MKNSCHINCRKVLEVDDIPDYANCKAVVIIGGILTREQGFSQKMEIMNSLI